MKTRIITALIGTPLLVLILVHGGSLANVCAALMALIAVYESYAALGKAGYRIFRWGTYGAALLMFPFALIFGALDPLIIVSLAMGMTMTGILLSKEPNFRDAAASLYPIFTVLLPFAMMMMMMTEHRTFGSVPGMALVVMSFAVAFMGDTTAYFIGSAFGRHMLCPKVSPKKTVEGSAGYFLGSVVGALLVRAFFVHLLNMSMPGIPAAILLGIVGGAVAQIGDLSASLLKRHCGIKDYGYLFPGHGGVLDRFDSVIFTLIVFYCYTLLLI